MLELNLQFFGGRGATSGGSGATSVSGGNTIKDTRSLISERERQREMVDQTLGVFSDVYSQYGESSQVTDIQLAKMSKKSSAIAYYDSQGNIAVNERYFDKQVMDAAYQACVASGFHPSNGKKSALEAVVAHEIGHKLTASIAEKMGYDSWGGLDKAAGKIVKQAAGKTKHKSVSKLAEKISGYAKHSPAEAIAEAFSDVYCNGSKARAESRAIVDVIDSYLKGGK